MAEKEHLRLTQQEIADAARKRLETQKNYIKVKEDAYEQEQRSLSTIAADDKARHNLTFVFLKCFFGLIVGAWVFALVYNWSAVYWIIWLKNSGCPELAEKIPLLELEKLLSLLISALGTSLGFIIGYYFKNKDK